MGIIISTLAAIPRILFADIKEMPCETVPICFLREEDYSITGTIRSGAQQKWNHSLYSMIHVDLKTRLLLWPAIQKRMDRTEASLKYTNCSLENLVEKFPEWEEKKIYEAHDLFQAFEVDGDGLIEIAEMSVGLDNLGDTSSKQDRLTELSIGDEDGTGSIDFEEFLTILYDQQQVTKTPTKLAKTFMKVNDDVKMIRWMSTVQQIHAGYL
ncbi:squidulin [Folsomia candida]|uniref:Caltractin n=1 Tax=Folsomia candida TaxID=158441 RepID=A0A226EI88_FOLCA|nr:squidulin [Folsomia candida]OXA56296.1 Caltractin [Folsomia candida]